MLPFATVRPHDERRLSMPRHSIHEDALVRRVHVEHGDPAPPADCEAEGVGGGELARKLCATFQPNLDPVTDRRFLLLGFDREERDPVLGVDRLPLG
jgi:hypothetical protein